MKNEMNDNLDEFDKYVISFDLEDKMIEYKISKEILLKLIKILQNFKF